MGPGEPGEAALSGQSGVGLQDSGWPRAHGAQPRFEMLVVGQHSFFFLFSTFSWFRESVAQREGADAECKACPRAPTCLTSSSVV